MKRCHFRPLGVVLIATTLFGFLNVYFWLFGLGGSRRPLTSDAPSIVIDVHHLKRLQYIINSDVCSTTDGEIYMLVLVGSHPTHEAERNVIRSTWGNPQIPKYPFRLVFLFGNLSNGWQNEALVAESQVHGDIVQGDFTDSFHNMVLRDLMGFQWAWNHCNRAKYIVRADDDIAVNIYKVINKVEGQFEIHKSDSVCCYEIASDAAPMRSGRYAVSYFDYYGRYYANYCFGWIYILTPLVAKQLVDVSQSVKPIWINDVYITGFLVKALGLNLYKINLKYTLKYTDMLAFGNYQLGTYDIGPIQRDLQLINKIQEIYKKIYLNQTQLLSS